VIANSQRHLRRATRYSAPVEIVHTGTPVACQRLPLNSMRSFYWPCTAGANLSLFDSVRYGEVRAKSFRIRSYGKCARKSFRIRSYKIPRGVVPPSHPFSPLRLYKLTAKVPSSQLANFQLADTSSATRAYLIHPMSIARSGVQVHG